VAGPLGYHANEVQVSTGCSRCAPVLDLTLQGIEPNPGPVAAPPQRDPHRYDHYPVMSQVLGPVFDDAMDWVDVNVFGNDRPIDEWDDGVNVVSRQHFSKLAEKSLPPRPLVGIETNPGPVTLPVRGKGTKKLQQLARNIKREVKLEQAVAQVKRSRSTVAPNSFGAAVSAPTIATRGRVSGVPRFKRLNKDLQTIGHTEMIGLVTGTANFTATKFAMQPGLSTTFPWLSTQTLGWEKYRWRKLRIWYETRTGTTTVGSILLVADYDAADSAPTTQFAASTYHGTSDDAPWKESYIDLDMNRSQELYLRNGPLAANLDIKTYDFANLFVCTTDGAAVNWGKVYAEYEIEMINAQVIQIATNAGGSIRNTVAGSPTDVFGANPTVTNGSFITSVNSSGVVQLEGMTAGNEYLITIRMSGTAMTAINLSTPGGLTFRTTVSNDLVNAAGNEIVEIVTCTATAATGGLTITATATTVTGAILIFSAMATSPTL
jgi:hypothetical protein